MKKTLSLLASTSLLAGLLVVGAAAPASAAPQTGTESACSGDSLITRTMEAGTQWQMCWRVDRYKGLIVEKVAYKGKDDAAPIMVLDSLAIGQLNVPYDTGYNVWNDITSYGFGGGYTRRMEPQQCEGGEIRSTYIQETRPDLPVLCIDEVEAGLAYNSFERKAQMGTSPDDGLLFTAQSTDLVLRYTAKVDWYEYQTELRFADDGEIDVRLGATGDLAPSDYSDGQAGLAQYGIGPEQYENYGWPIGQGAEDYAASHYHSAIYRVDFGIGDSGDQAVEQFDTTFTGTAGRRADMLSTEVTPITHEGKFTKDTRRLWRVLNPESLNGDGHARSYEIIPGSGPIYGANPETDYDVAFSEFKPDEQYASFNLITSKPNVGVPEYIADGEALTDPIAWVNVGFHHIVRDEDQSPMPIHWQGFTLYPRDFSAQSPVIPEQRKYVNGNVGRINTPITPVTPSPEPTSSAPATPQPTASPTSTPAPTTTPSTAPTQGPGAGDGGNTGGGENGNGAAAVTMTSTTLTPGATTTVRGTGFESGESVTATMYSTPTVIGTFTADSFGAVEFPFTVPLSAEAGSHRIELTAPSGVTVSQGFTVQRQNAAATLIGQLGQTGTPEGMLTTTGAALLLLAAGLGTWALSRRRHMGDAHA